MYHQRDIVTRLCNMHHYPATDHHCDLHNGCRINSIYPKQCKEELPQLGNHKHNSGPRLSTDSYMQMMKGYCQQPDNDDTSSSFSSSITSSESDELKPSNINVFSATSTLHGFSHMFALHHSSLRKFAWTVAFLTSLSLLLYQVKL